MRVAQWFAGPASVLMDLPPGGISPGSISNRPLKWKEFQNINCWLVVLPRGMLENSENGMMVIQWFIWDHDYGITLENGAFSGKYHAISTICKWIPWSLGGSCWSSMVLIQSYELRTETLLDLRKTRREKDSQTYPFLVFSRLNMSKRRWFEKSSPEHSTSKALFSQPKKLNRQGSAKNNVWNVVVDSQSPI